MSTPDDKERLLGILHAHGQQFLSAFNIPPTSTREETDLDESQSESEEEWTGFGSSNSRGTSESSDGESEQDDGFVADSSGMSNVMTFQEPTRKPLEANFSAKELRKSFMSSKVSNVTLSRTQPASKKKIADGGSDDERTNSQNDALLHRLVHTELLSGSLNPDLDLTHAQKGRALAGRVLEITGQAKLGRGENEIRQEQRNKAAKHVREGLGRKQKEREQKTLEEAKNLGNYHPTLKRLYDSKSASGSKKRARGLGMGIGKFAGGTLKLSRKEIAAATGSGRRSMDDGTRRQLRYKAY